MNSNSVERYETALFNFKILLGNMLISLLNNANIINNAEFVGLLLSKYGKNISKIQLDEMLISIHSLSFFISSNFNNIINDLKDKLLVLGANRNLLSTNPYSLGMMKFGNKYGFMVSNKYYSRTASNAIVIKSVLADLGKSVENLKNIIHITGSNGKGSTSAFLHSILEAHGYTVNRYYKPYLIRINE
ncbi:MAG: hypothetical protein LBS34_02195, partial [Rickettsiales bacterium]|nr:hypothetical protein [Rickettsiales bacterium]